MWRLQVDEIPHVGEVWPTNLQVQERIPLGAPIAPSIAPDDLAPDFAGAVAPDYPVVPDFPDASNISVGRVRDEDPFAVLEASRLAELDTLVGPAGKGDREALARLLEIVRPIAVRYSRGRLGVWDRGGMTADDVAQEICLAVITALPRYRDESRPFMAFVYGIAAHKIADVRRAAARNRIDAVAEVPDEVVSDAGPEEKVLASEASNELGLLLATLAEKDRDLLVLRVALGLSAEQVAQTMGSTPGAVRVAQHRALTKLRAAEARLAAGEPLEPPRKRKRRARKVEVGGAV